MTPTLETPCLTQGKWLTCSTDSRRVDGHEYCGQCFPNGEDSVARFGVETFLLGRFSSGKLHRSVDTGKEADTSMFGTDNPDRTLASRLLNDEVEVAHQFEWDRQHSPTGGDA
ncbi:hypothetical protein [Haloarcula marina]|uniref:hypothetical protein n=1 Tax=Haloarcula marina TaxID=2961574 RepID=UPI0020B88AA6|nr:hypothetical protein [Halomicroarcula marina]